MAVMASGPFGMARGGGMVLRTAKFRCYGDWAARHEEAIHVFFPWIASTHDGNLLLGEHVVLGVIVDGLLQMIHSS